MSAVMNTHVSSWDRLGFTLFLAVAIHAVLLLGITFSGEEKKPLVKSLEITLTQAKSVKAPEKADFIAPENQLGSGTEQEKRKISTMERADFQAPQPQRLSAQQTAVAEPEPPTDHIPPATKELSTKPENSPEKSVKGGEKVITTTAVKQQVQTKKQQKDKAAASPRSTGGATSLLSRSLEIASLQAQIDQQDEWMAKQPRVKRLTSSSAKKREDAAYLDSWRRKIEMVGNLNYPEEARQAKTYGSLRLLVVIMPDGSVKEVNVLKSSGHKVLDDAAVRIVRLAAPFQPFPVEMRKTTDLLEIIRTWKFEQRAQVF